MSSNLSSLLNTFTACKDTKYDGKYMKTSSKFYANFDIKRSNQKLVTHLQKLGKMYAHTLALLIGEPVAGLFLPPTATTGGPGMAGADGSTGAGPGSTGTAPAKTDPFLRLLGGTRPEGSFSGTGSFSNAR